MPNRAVITWHPIEGTLRRRAGDDNTAPSSRQSALAGSDPVGSREYAIPSTNTVFVATSGNDTAGNGTIENPYRTLRRATSTAPANSTIILRGGEYHEGGVWWRVEDSTAQGNATLVGAALANTGVTIQNYPGEAVWFDGSTVPAGDWTFDGTNWRIPFVTKFDRTQTHTRGQDTGNWPGGGGFVVSQFPYASWPEQLFYDGQLLEQVGSLAQLSPGKFFVEGTTVGGSGVNKNAFISTHYVIRDDPNGHEVRISSLSRLGSFTQADTTIRGIGVRRYAPALVDWGAVYVGSQANFLMEHCVIEDVSALGLHTRSPNAVMRHLTVRRCGCMGISAGGDGGVLEHSLFQENVNRRYNYGPSAGDIKLGGVWSWKVRHNRFEDTYGHALWFDESCFMNDMYGNDFYRQYGHGINYEISSRGYIVDNYFEDVGSSSDITTRPPYACNPIWLSGSNQCEVWNNTIVGSWQQIKIAQDYRVPTASEPVDRYGRDNSRPAAFYDGSDPSYPYNGVMTWTTGDITIKNNILYNIAPGNAVQNVFYSLLQDTQKDLRPRRDTTDFNIQTGGNLYNRLSSTLNPRFANGVRSTPANAVEIYGSMTGSATLFPDGTSAPSWQSVTGEVGSVFVDNEDATIDGAYPYTIRPNILSNVVPQPLDAAIASRTERTPGETHSGIWLE